jgi:hypothetical protein
MAVGSNVNPNYPIPGIDQSSRGFRDNFSTIKLEIENLQSKQLVFQGALLGTPPVIIDNSNSPVVINAHLNSSNITINGTTANGVLFIGANLAVTSGNTFVFNSSTNRVGINIPTPLYTLDVGGLIASSAGSVANAAVQTVSIATVIDSWATTSYRTANYVVTATNATATESTAILSTQFGGQAYSTIQNSVKNTNSGLGYFNVSVIGSTFELTYTPYAANVSIKLSRNYITI